MTTPTPPEGGKLLRDVRSMSDRELVNFMMSDDPLAKARTAFSAAYGRIEQAEMQARKPDIFEIRKMEFEAVQSIITAWNTRAS